MRHLPKTRFIFQILAPGFIPRLHLSKIYGANRGKEMAKTKKETAQTGVKKWRKPG
jgi:hypothetical protein